MWLGEDKISFTETLWEWINEYSEQREVGIGEFLKKKLGKSVFGTDVSEVNRVSEEISEEVAVYERNKGEIISFIEHGGSKEEWLSEQLESAVDGLEKEDKIQILGTIHDELAHEVGIETETSRLRNADFLPLESRQIEQSVGELVEARTMQILCEEYETDAEQMIPTEPAGFVETALEENSDTELKTVVSGALVMLHKLGKLPLVPQTAPVKVLVHIACFAVDHAETVVKIAKREISLTEGLSHMARDAFATVKGILFDRDGTMKTENLANTIPLLGKPLSIVNRISGGITNLLGSTSLQENISNVRKNIVSVAQNFADGFVAKAVSTVKNVADRIKSFLFG